MKKIAILASHPVHYQTALFREMSKSKELEVRIFFCWEIGKSYFDTEFNRQVDFNMPDLEKIEYEFLKNFSLSPSSSFWGQINPGIVKKIIFGEYDALIVLGWNSFTNWLAFVAAFLKGTPVFLRGENPLNQEKTSKKIKFRIKKLILSNLFKKIKAFLYIGKQNKLFYKYYGVPEEKLYFAPYAMDNERLKKEFTRLKNLKTQLREKNGIPLDSKLILFVGKLIPKKRPEDLLLAYADIDTENKMLCFVGDGALLNRLKEVVKDKNIKNVVFLGFKNQSELPEYYALADIFVLPSGIGETWGLVVNEAMCFGLPVIVSDIVGCGEDLVTENNGLIFKCGDVSELSRAIEKLFSNDKGLEKFGRASLEHIDNYSYNKDVLSILKALQNTIKTDV